MFLSHSTSFDRSLLQISHPQPLQNFSSKFPTLSLSQNFRCVSLLASIFLRQTFDDGLQDHTQSLSDNTENVDLSENRTVSQNPSGLSTTIRDQSFLSSILADRRCDFLLAALPQQPSLWGQFTAALGLSSVCSAMQQTWQRELPLILLLTKRRVMPKDLHWPGRSDVDSFFSLVYCTITLLTKKSWILT